MKYSKLRGLIREKLGSEKKYQELMGFSSTTKTKKLSGEREFTISEIKKTVEILGIDTIEIAKYFFC